MLRKGALMVAMVGALSACGHTPQERLASGVLIGGAIGAAVSLAAEQGHGRYDSGRRYHYDHQPKRRGGSWRRHRDWEDYDCRYRC